MKLFVSQRQRFPDPAQTRDSSGVVAIGGDLSVDSLLEAYSFGIFPWPHEGFPCLWYCPPQRGVLDFQDLHLSRSLSKWLKRTSLEVTFNQDFAAVIEACSQVPRPGQQGTWINTAIQKAYLEFHRAGYAHSVECWEGPQLVGGLYGVYVAGVFSGESMFYRRDNASKLSLLKLIESLSEQDLSWMDIQMVTPHLQQLGGKYISRRRFLKRVEEARLEAQPLRL